MTHHAPAQRNVEDSDFVSAVPHSNHLTVETANWQNRDSSPQQSVIILHCHICLGLSNPYISSALCTGIIPFSDCGELAANLVSGVVSFMVEGWVGSVKV